MRSQRAATQKRDFTKPHRQRPDLGLPSSDPRELSFCCVQSARSVGTETAWIHTGQWLGPACHHSTTGGLHSHSQKGGGAGREKQDVMRGQLCGAVMRIRPSEASPTVRLPGASEVALRSCPRGLPEPRTVLPAGPMRPSERPLSGPRGPSPLTCRRLPEPCLPRPS